MKILLFIIITCWTFEVNGQITRLRYTDIDFREEFVDTAVNKVDSILILGIGASLERIFLNDLSNKMIESLNKKKIFASYTYLGKSISEIRQNKHSVDLQDYKAVFILRPTDTGSFTVQLRKGDIIVPSSTEILGIDFATFTRKRDTYRQSFDFSLFINEESLKPIWRATADIDCEPGKKAGYTKMARKILGRLAVNKIIP